MREKLQTSMHVTNPHGGKVAFALGLNCVAVVYLLYFERVFNKRLQTAFLRKKLQTAMPVTKPHGRKVAFAAGLNCVAVSCLLFGELFCCSVSG